MVDWESLVKGCGSPPSTYRDFFTISVCVRSCASSVSSCRLTVCVGMVLAERLTPPPRDITSARL